MRKSPRSLLDFVPGVAARNQCDPNQGLKIFDISALEWTESFTVDGESKYTVPEKVYSIIGGE